jgi:hypothetical protein
MSDFLHQVNESIAFTQGQIPTEIINYGHFIKQYDGSGFVGGMIQRVTTDHMGRVRAESVMISSVLGCGHLVTSTDQIGGYCQVCGRICCRSLNCLAVCDITGITVCRQHFEVKYGVVVSSHAQKGLWRLKAKKIGQRKRMLIDDKKYYTETP